MGKLIFFAAVVAAMVAISLAYGESSSVSTQCQCQRELQESSLELCQQFVDRQLNMVPAISQRPSPSPWIPQEQKMWCCQQLQQISSGCREAAVRSIVRKYEQDLEAAQQPQIGQQQVYPVHGEPAKQQPEITGRRYPLSDEPAKRQPQIPGERYPVSGEPAKQQPQIPGLCYPAAGEPAKQQQHVQGQRYPIPDEPAKQQPQIPGQRFPAPGEPTEQQPPQVGGQVHHGCPSRHTQNRLIARQQPIGGILPVGLPEEIARERLTRAQQLAAQLPAQCGLERGAFLRPVLDSFHK
ncbi:glutenin, high molecular weight subunit DY10 [Brachypodium distachyon]|uniref:Bifunctional inhibitor/plant lipid transfer protein/seed storage helical domain-containing protein n=1 Tax=Brachypodium distachyon TaxID=15368 RepID=I1HI01_BRADI|nr:glutenin, high molecular weight subunit DY10 [Brachypodium distachyon]KQK05569.1 hypothetical protein BRADI_2g20910v3 [Brachypodium distachyon]|eukprot:XP_010231209.3 glutenin, high molecular weight subunit DY10 [Brachypodium distachyon]